MPDPSQTTPDQNPATNPAAAQATPAPAADQAARESSAKAAPSPSADELIAVAKKEAADNYERYLRLAADMENLRKRTIREKDELRQFAAGRVLEDLLPVLDNLALGLQAAKAPNADLKTLVGGISMVLEQLKSALSQHGLKEVNPLKQPFDPNQHESLSTQASPDVPEGAVAAVVRVGYSLNGRLLRPASVILSSGPDKPAVV